MVVIPRRNLVFLAIFSALFTVAGFVLYVRDQELNPYFGLVYAMAMGQVLAWSIRRYRDSAPAGKSTA